MTESVWVLEWAAPPGLPLPTATAHRTEAGALAAIAVEAQRVGVEQVEEARPGPLQTFWVGECVAMLRQVPLL